MQAGPAISVIVCAYTELRWEQLLSAVDSLQRQTLTPSEIIVVIDHNPGLAARAKAHFRDINVLENQEMRGLSGARNTGIACAHGELIAFMDEDAIAAPDWLERIASAYADQQVIGVGGTIRPYWEKSRPGWFPVEFDWVVGCTYRGMPTAPAPIRNLIGCNMSFRREVFAAIGGFRNGIGRVGTRPVGCEETELCIRIQQHYPEKILLFDPNIIVDHRVPQNRATWAYFRARCYAEGLSKALVTHVVGAKDGLSSERAYTMRTLPQGVWNGLKRALQGDLNGLKRAAAIIIGLLLTGSGYLIGKLSVPGQAAQPSSPIVASANR